MQEPTPTKIPQKQLLKIPLFRNTRQINGQRIFKQLHESSHSLTFQGRYTDTGHTLKRSFLYVREGEVLVYKVGGEGMGNGGGGNGKCLMRSYRAGEYCGFQDYPLYWGEDYVVEVVAKSVLIVVPLAMFYRFFRRVISMTHLQSKAQFIKKLPIFRGVQPQKLFKLACLSQKLRINPQTTLLTQNSPISYILLLYSGKLQLRSSHLTQTIICGKNEHFLLKEIMNNIDTCYFTVTCVQEADVLVIRREDLLGVVDVRYSMGDGIGEKREGQGHGERERERKVSKDQESLFDSGEAMGQTWNQISRARSKSQSKSRTRGATNFPRSLFSKTHTQINQHSSTLTPSHSKPATRTLTQKQKTLESQPSPSLPQPQPQKFSQTSYSLGEIQLLKFIKRKQKIETRNFFKYIESRAPEIVLNPSKQFALVKPLYKNASQYVRNMKRRIKHSISINASVNLTTHFNDFTL